MGLLFIPASMDLAMVRSFDIGFVLWAASLIMASAWFSSAVWKRSLATLPQILLGATLFCGLFVCSTFLNGKEERAKLEHQQALQHAQRQEQRHAEETAALNAIALHGLVAFSELLHDTEEMELEFRINSTQPIAPEQLIAASHHYQNPKIMMALATNRNNPEPALEILYQHTVSQEKQAPPHNGAAEQMYEAIARNPMRAEIYC